ncbi:MAG: hypothetical protein P8X98_00115 [Woeseiaceae bacterium]
MAEHIKDEKDRMLDSMFASEPIADDGFSAQIVKKVRRRIWLRRLALPVATLIGGLIAFKPMTEMVRVVAGLTTLIPEDILRVSDAVVPQLPMLVLGAMLLATILVGLRTLED